MAKTTKPITETDKNQAERALLDSWHPHIKSAMESLHCKFQSDTKFILTESDLKCWLFYYLQAEKPYIPFTVHTEVTHYAKHVTNKGKKKVEETKHKFRDLSLLCPWEVKANEEYIKQNGNKKDILSKGFKHVANAIHFELKFVRVTGSSNQIDGLKEDIDKLKNYSPQSGNKMRDFVIVCGSRSENTTVEHFKKAVEDKVLGHSKAILKERVRFYLFDREQMVYGKWENNEVNFVTLTTK
jgi:hypothetical protein